jgi:hypothetical protein
MATILGRQDAPRVVEDMIATLDLGPFITAPDELVLTEPGWTLFDINILAREAIFLKSGLSDLSLAPFGCTAQYQGRGGAAPWLRCLYGNG